MDRRTMSRSRATPALSAAYYSSHFYQPSFSPSAESPRTKSENWAAEIVVVRMKKQSRCGGALTIANNIPVNRSLPLRECFPFYNPNQLRHIHSKPQLSRSLTSHQRSGNRSAHIALLPLPRPPKKIIISRRSKSNENRFNRLNKF